MNKEKSAVLEEFKKAKKENRQPKCIYCKKPLVITETQYINLIWSWDEDEKIYVKSEEEDGSSDGPRCKECETKDWDFTNNGYLEY